MEHISPAQLSKYRYILNEINAEYAKKESLQGLLCQESNKLIAMRVAMEETFAKQHVFQVLVKVYDSIFDIFYVYGQQFPIKLEVLQKYVDNKFYVVQVLISKLFQEKIMNHKWLLSVCVSNQKKRITKNEYLENVPCLVIVPFDKSIEPVLVETALYMQFEQFCGIVNMSSRNIDISYHFSTHANSIQESGQSILVSHLYNPEILQHLQTSPAIFQYTFKCKCTMRHFFEALVKNCYHRMNPEIFSTILVDKPIITVHVVIANTTSTIKFDKVENSLSITSNMYNLHHIKVYFIDDIECQNVLVEKMWLVALKNLRQYLRCELNETPVNTENLKIIYNELRKLMFELAV